MLECDLSLGDCGGLSLRNIICSLLRVIGSNFIVGSDFVATRTSRSTGQTIWSVWCTHPSTIISRHLILGVVDSLSFPKKSQFSW